MKAGSKAIAQLAQSANVDIIISDSFTGCVQRAGKSQNLAHWFLKQQVVNISISAFSHLRRKIAVIMSAFWRNDCQATLQLIDCESICLVIQAVAAAFFKQEQKELTSLTQHPTRPSTLGATGQFSPPRNCYRHFESDENVFSCNHFVLPENISCLRTCNRQTTYQQDKELLR